MNLPGRGFKEAFSEKGLQDNRKLFELLEREDFEIEDKHFPWRGDGQGQAHEMLVVVARKK